MKARTSLVILLSTLFLAVILSVTSCKKSPYELGLSLLPPTDTLSVKTTDTTSVVAYSVISDSIRTDRTSTSILGSFNDPVFGKTTANFYTQVRLSTEGVSFGNDPVLDSVVLMLRYSSGYGDSTTLQHIRVYEVSEDMHADSIYYSNHHVGHYSTLLSDFTFQPNMHDSVKYYKTKVAPHLRINLSNLTNYFGNKILYAPKAILATNNYFIQFIKGLYIESSPVAANGGLISFNMNDVLTEMMIYFHNHDDSGNLRDSLNYDFVINSLCARFNTFDHNNYVDASPDFKRQVLNHDTALGKEVLYFQGLAGVRTKVRFPFIKNFGNSGKMVINNAILVLKNAYKDATLFPPPEITLIQVDSAGKSSYLVDDNEGTAYFGGTYNSTDGSYHFRITRHIQQVIQGKIKNNDLYLMVNSPSQSLIMPNRMIGTGTTPQLPVIPGDRLQLQIIYTKLR